MSAVQYAHDGTALRHLPAARPRPLGHLCGGTPADQNAVEDSVSYRGRYFVLMGRVNPLDGIGPKELGVDKLIEEASDPEVKEVVIATSYTPEGEATAHMVAAALKRHIPELRVTRLARGLLPA